MIEGFVIGRTFRLLILQQRLDLRGERDASMMNAKVERLDSDPVANQPELALPRIPQRNGKHAAKLVNAIDAPLLEGMPDHFRIRMDCFPTRAPSFLQLHANLCVVVDLAVEDHP